jgi:hypothetical protein
MFKNKRMILPNQTNNAKLAECTFVKDKVQKESRGIRGRSLPEVELFGHKFIDLKKAAPYCNQVTLNRMPISKILNLLAHNRSDIWIIPCNSILTYLNSCRSGSS